MKAFSSVKNRIIAGILIAILAVVSIYAFHNFFTNAEVFYNIDDSLYSEMRLEQEGDYNFIVKNDEYDIGTAENPFTILEIVPERSMGMFGYYIPGCEPFSALYLDQNRYLESTGTWSPLVQAGIFSKHMDNTGECTYVYINGERYCEDKNLTHYGRYQNTPVNRDLLIRGIFNRSTYGEEGDEVYFATDIYGVGEHSEDNKVYQGGFKTQLITITPEELWADAGKTVPDSQYLKLIETADFVIFNEQLMNQDVDLRGLYQSAWKTITGNSTYEYKGNPAYKFDPARCDIPAEFVETLFRRQCGEYGRKAAIMLDQDLKGFGENTNYKKMFFLMMADTPADTNAKYFSSDDEKHYEGCSSHTLLDMIKNGNWSENNYNRTISIGGHSHTIEFNRSNIACNPNEMFDKNSVREKTYVFGNDGNDFTNKILGGVANKHTDNLFNQQKGQILNSSDNENSIFGLMKYVYGKQTNYKNVLRILEIEPTLEVTNVDGTTASAFRVTKKNYSIIENLVSSWFEGRYDVTNMTFGEFNTKKEELGSNYDIVLMGMNGMEFCMDTGEGDALINSPGTSYNKNLLTSRKYLELLEFSKMGAVICFNDSPNKITARYGTGGVFFHYVKNNPELNVLSTDVYNVCYINRVLVAGEANRSLCIARMDQLTDDARLKQFNEQIQLTKIKMQGVGGAIPEAYTGVSSKFNTGGKGYVDEPNPNTLAFKVSIQGYDAGTYDLRLLVDKDGDDNFQGSTLKNVYLDSARCGKVVIDDRYYDESGETVDFKVYEKKGGDWVECDKTVTIPTPVVNNGVVAKNPTKQLLIVSEDINLTGYVPWQLEVVKRTEPIDTYLGTWVWWSPAEKTYCNGYIRNVMHGATWIKPVDNPETKDENEAIQTIKVLQLDLDSASGNEHYNTSDMLFNSDEVVDKYYIDYEYTAKPNTVNFYDYDVLVVGLSGKDDRQHLFSKDANGKVSTELEDELMKYIQSGKGIVFTNNSLLESKDDFEGDTLKVQSIPDPTGYSKNTAAGESQIRPYLNMSGFVPNNYFTKTDGEAIHFNNYGQLTDYPYDLNDSMVAVNGVSHAGINVKNAVASKFIVNAESQNYYNHQIELCDTDIWSTVVNDAYNVVGGDGANLSYLFNACNVYYLGFGYEEYKAKPDDVSDAEKLFVNTLIGAYRQSRLIALQCENKRLYVDNRNYIAKDYLELYEKYDTSGVSSSAISINEAVTSVNPEAEMDEFGNRIIKLAVVVDEVDEDETYEFAFLNFLKSAQKTHNNAGNGELEADTIFAYRQLTEGVNEKIPYAAGEGKTVDVTFTKVQPEEVDGKFKVAELTFAITQEMIEDEECNGVFEVQLRPYKESHWYWKPHQAYCLAKYEIDVLEMLMFNLN